MIYAYIRVSTEMQTFEVQKYEIENYCAGHGLHVDQWCLETVSGTRSVEKRSLGKLLRRMREGDQLLCTEISRLGRNMMMVMAILNTCSSKGIAIHSIKDNFDLSDTINAKIIAFCFALAAEIERNLISQRTREALAVKRQAGIRLGRPPGRSSKKTQFLQRRAEVQQWLASGLKMKDAARRLGIHENTLRTYLTSTSIEK
ncbi:MAG: recombinase family protein [Bacteroidales bacterium]|nr:recombinase family protein [Bacteroidales bacterium]